MSKKRRSKLSDQAPDEMGEADAGRENRTKLTPEGKPDKRYTQRFNALLWKEDYIQFKNAAKFNDESMTAAVEKLIRRYVKETRQRIPDDFDPLKRGL